MLSLFTNTWWHHYFPFYTQRKLFGIDYSLALPNLIWDVCVEKTREVTDSSRGYASFADFATLGMNAQGPFFMLVTISNELLLPEEIKTPNRLTST